MAWSKTGKGVLLYLYAEYVMWNAGQDESQTGIKIAGSNINNLRYADDTTLMAESEEHLKKSVSCVGAKSQLYPTLCNYGL